MIRNIVAVAVVCASSAAIAAEAPPFALTASDGSGLVLERLDAKAVVEGPLAFTELHLYFHNPEPRVREGTFEITLPAGAAVSRFAMEIDGEMQEAEVVDRTYARRIFDDFLHRKQDPALLEKAAGNQFTARVFPIPASGNKHLVIAFSQQLSGRYTLPLRGLPTIARVDVRLGDQVIGERNWQPDRDFVASTDALPAAGADGLVVASITAPGSANASAAPTELTLFVDTSASRALGFARYVASIRELVGALRTKYGDDLLLQVVAFDQDTQPIFHGNASYYSDLQDQALIARGAAGASDLGQALVATRLHRRVVVITDGVITAGADADALRATIRGLPIDRLDVVLSGGIRDDKLAAVIARAGLPHAGDVLDLDRGTAQVAAALGETIRTDVPIDVVGATWVYPRRVPALRAGSEVVVYARVVNVEKQLDVAIGGVHRAVAVATATPALIERAVDGAQIEELEAKLAAGDSKVRDELVRRSVAARIVSTQTAMLVLETEADYARYHIDRRGLADMLVIGPKGLDQLHRKKTYVASAAPVQPTVEHTEVTYPMNFRSSGADTTQGNGSFASLTGTADISSGFDDTNVYGGTIGEGRYGTIGHGASSGGSGFGVGGGRGGMHARTANAPSVVIGQPVSMGDLDKSVLRRYMRRNIERIRYCYERALMRDHSLAGTVQAHFTIDADGKVTTSTADGLDPEVAACVAEAIRTIEFPKAVGGSGIQVNYPFTFVAEGRDLPPRGDADPEAAPAAAAPLPPAPLPEPVEPLIPGGSPSPLTGKLSQVMAALARHKPEEASAIATRWHDAEPGDALALVALGEVLEARGERARAARIYGSIIDLFPSRADLRRFAGERLERTGARTLATDTYRRAVTDRPDHLSGHRLLAYALARGGDYAGAFDVIMAAVDKQFAGNRMLDEDAAILGAAYVAHGGARDAVAKRLAAHQLALATKPSTRFVLYWETDANDVDLHVADRKGHHAWYQNMQMSSGGELFADVTTGYGPECFAIPGKPTAGPYHLAVNYYAQGPMGYGMGMVQILAFDGKNLAFDDRPYIVMTNQAFVDLGTY